ncbi:MAG: hypothetical protein P1U46_00840 [Patescibacteria group bacterium]|nr:hypothetical protein [Patescibacteria group bacterium]
MAKINRNKKNVSSKPKEGFHRKKNTKRGNYIVRDEYAIKAQKA